MQGTVKVLTLIALALGIQSCSIWPSESHSLWVVSPIQLRITPERFDSKRVNLKGYVDSQASLLGEALLLFQTKDDANIRNFAAQVPIFLSSDEYRAVLEKCADSYVEVIGTFFYGSGDEQRGIRSVENLAVIPPKADYANHLTPITCVGSDDL